MKLWSYNYSGLHIIPNYRYQLDALKPEDFAHRYWWLLSGVVEGAS